MIALLDNDFIKKIVACNLWHDFLRIYKLQVSDIFILPTARFYFRNKKPEKLYISQQCHATLMTIINSLAGIPTGWNNPEIQSQLQTDQIDGGESILLAVAYKNTKIFVFTGDKRCLTALATHPLYSGYHKRLFCLEQVVHTIISQDFEGTLPGIVAGLNCDTSLRACYGSGLASTKENALSGLQAYIKDLRRATGNLLA